MHKVLAPFRRAKLRLGGSVQTQEAPLQHLLASNASPSPSEENLIRETISSAEDELVATKDPNRIAHCTKVIAQHKPLLSAVRRVPSELWAEIFSHTTTPGTRNMEDRRQPWLLSSVCRSWRACALSCPLLWTEVLVDLTKKRRHPEHHLSALQLLLARSGNALLTVHIFAEHPTSGTPHRDSNAAPALSLIIQHSPRWHTVQLKITAPEWEIFSPIRGRLPHLRVLHLDIWPFQDEGHIDLFGLAPALDEVHLDGLVSPCTIDLPWHQLTTLWDKGGVWGNLHNLCSTRSERIRHIHVGGLGIANEDPILGVELPSLQTLALDFRFGGINPTILDDVTLPRLENIQIAGYQGGLIPKLTQLISRSLRTPLPSQSHLLKLSFRTSLLAPSSLPTLLHLTPHLEYLDTVLLSRSDLSQLIFCTDRPVLVPKLHTLRLHINPNGNGTFLGVQNQSGLWVVVDVLNLLGRTRGDLDPWGSREEERDLGRRKSSRWRTKRPPRVYLQDHEGRPSSDEETITHTASSPLPPPPPPSVPLAPSDYPTRLTIRLVFPSPLYCSAEVRTLEEARKASLPLSSSSSPGPSTHTYPHACMHNDPADPNTRRESTDLEIQLLDYWKIQIEEHLRALRSSSSSSSLFNSSLPASNPTTGYYPAITYPPPIPARTGVAGFGFGTRGRSGGRGRNVNLKSLRNLDVVFGQVEKYKVKDVVSLHASTIHFTLKRIAQSHPSNIPGDKRYQFRQRASQILNAWSPILEADLVNRRWAQLGPVCVVYVPLDSALRSSPDALSIIYGIQDDILYTELNWPNFMLFE